MNTRRKLIHIYEVRSFNEIQYEFITEKEHEVNEEGIKNYSIDQLYKNVNNKTNFIIKDNKWFIKRFINDSTKQKGNLCFYRIKTSFSMIATFDYMVTLCEKMLGHDYMRRHNEILSGTKAKNSFSSTGKIQKDSHILNRETEKLRKYDLIANELGLIHEFKTRVIPYMFLYKGTRNFRLNRSIHPISDLEHSIESENERTKTYFQSKPFDIKATI
ncbi:hypothetical protein NAPIS_ORF01140 [Vairimorpha apis BRL 01]|uniref:Uncharacterized protein n=1 Tax=Vairimorpha apis BRL 01 TaxID=1037528 RepID=T0L167_9MICR|nr:hypothetical protein NAPIS_ORF01140 [Vairimorpha apis BRL 01]